MILAGHPPAEQALSEQVQRGPAEDHGRANAARVSTPRTAEEDAGSDLVRQLRDREDVDEVEEQLDRGVCCVPPVPRGRR